MNRPPGDPDVDPLLAALNELPRPASADDVERRILRRSRALYVRERDGSAWRGSLSAFAHHVIVPLSLVGIVVLYMAWAIGAALVPYR